MPQLAGLKSLDINDQLQLCASQLADIFERLEMPIKVSHENSREFCKVLSLTEDQKLTILSGLHVRIESFKQVEKAGENPLDSRVACWAAIKQLGLKPTTNLMEKIKNSDIVEIYSDNLIQLYSNMNFWQACSYTLDELLSNEFFDLFRRDDGITELIISKIKDVLSPDSSKTMYTGICDHFLEEIFSVHRRRFKIKQGILSPLFTKGNPSPVAFVATLEAKILKDNQ